MEFNIIRLIITLIAGYALGNISPSYLIGKRYDNIDIRQHGSGNAGATNSLRVMGKKKALLVFLIDALKGLVASRIGYALGGEQMALMGAVAVILGHVYPAVLRFRGGKGVATTLGALISIFPMYGLIAILLAITVIIRTRYVSLGSLTGAVVMAFILFMTKADSYSLSLVALIALFIMFTHRTNIKRLLNKTERKLGEN